MEIFKNFITTLVTAIVFITAIELVAPDNSMKKYLKFVMGLILISVMLSPIIKFLTEGEQALNNVIKTYTEDYEDGSLEASSKGDYDNLRAESFKENFNKNLVNKLEKEFKSTKFESSIDCEVDFDNMTLKVNEIKIGIKDGSVKKVEEVQITSNTSTNINTTETSKNDDTTRKVVEFLSEELEISKEKITAYYM